MKGLAAAALALVLLSGSAAAADGVQAPAAQSVVAKAAQALGGVEKVRAARNITLFGYGQFAWVVGAEEISASPHAPQKLQALNDLHRVYDLEHDRFQESERGFMQFPFLAANSYNFTLTDRRLDGDVAWDATSGNMFFSAPDAPHRVAASSSGALGADGVHMRRMWMLNNPVALERALMDPGTALSQPRVEGDYLVVDVRLKQGDTLSAGFSSPTRFCQDLCRDLPAFVRWTAPYPSTGQLGYTTWFTGYASIGGFMLPLGYDTRLDWRDIDFLRVFVDRYEIDGQTPDLAAPAAVRKAPAPPDSPVQPVKVEKVADHIWRLAPAGTTVIEFKDHLTLFELDASADQARATIAAARALVSGKPVTQLIASHEHFDHVAGLRQAVAEGLSVVSKRGNGLYFQEMVDHPAPDFPDDLARAPKPLEFIPVDEALTLSDPTMTLRVLWTRNNIHMADGVVAYAPAQKVIMEGDVATASYIWQFWPDSLRDIIDFYHLDVKIDSPVHSVDPQHPGALTMEQVDALLKGGTERARKLCADELAAGYHLAGCPVFSRRY